MHSVSCVWETRTTLGECPIWDVATGTIWWADVLEGRIMRFDPRDRSQHEHRLGTYVASLAPAGGGALLLATPAGIGRFDPANCTHALLGNPEADLPGNRFNDGKCDRYGNYWFGSMDWGCERPSGRLYRMTPTGDIETMLSGISVTNGPAFDAAGATMYHGDTMARRVDRFSINDDGTLGPATPFITLSAEDGYADGMTVDAADHLWLAHCGGGSVGRYTPDGRLERKISLPVSGVTSCAFGGADLATLYVTTSTHLLNAVGLLAEPLAGSLFAIEGLDVTGMPTAVYGDHQEFRSGGDKDG